MILSDYLRPKYRMLRSLKYHPVPSGSLQASFHHLCGSGQGKMLPTAPDPQTARDAAVSRSTGHANPPPRLCPNSKCTKPPSESSPKTVLEKSFPTQAWGWATSPAVSSPPMLSEKANHKGHVFHPRVLQEEKGRAVIVTIIKYWTFLHPLTKARGY